MTSTSSEPKLLKQDTRGRVRVTVERREALLDEFEKSGASGAKFAQLVGIKYATFAGWVLQRRRQRAKEAKALPRLAEQAEDGAGPVRLFEAVVESESAAKREMLGVSGLVVELPGGSRMRIESPVQMQMAAELVALLAQNRRC
jgi:hypothetical protein